MITLEMDSFDLYEIFLHEIMKKNGEGHNAEILKKVKMGISLDFNFEDYMKNRYKRKTFVKVKGGKEVGDDIIKIRIDGKEVTEIQFEDEILERVRLMRGWLWENMSVEKIGDLRGMGGNDGE